MDAEARQLYEAAIAVLARLCLRVIEMERERAAAGQPCPAETPAGELESQPALADPCVTTP